MNYVLCDVSEVAWLVAARVNGQEEFVHLRDHGGGPTCPQCDQEALLFRQRRLHQFNTQQGRLLQVLLAWYGKGTLYTVLCPG